MGERWLLPGRWGSKGRKRIVSGRVWEGECEHPWGSSMVRAKVNAGGEALLEREQCP